MSIPKALIPLDAPCLSPKWWCPSFLDFIRLFKCRIFHKVANFLLYQQRIAKEMASWLEASRRGVTSTTIVSHHYQLVLNSVFAVKTTRCMWLHMYQSFCLFSPRAILKRLNLLQIFPFFFIVQIT